MSTIARSIGVASLIDAGYFAKRITPKPETLDAPGVVEICSVSNCISQAPEGWIEHWLHNQFGWFNRASDAQAVVPPHQRAAYRLFAYRIYPALFRNGARHEFALPSDVHPDPVPPTFRSVGFDAVSKSIETSLGFECSPLSCNAMAKEVNTNESCLFDSLEEAIAGAGRFSVGQAEPGDYYVVEVLEEHRAANTPLHPTAALKGESGRG